MKRVKSMRNWLRLDQTGRAVTSGAAHEPVHHEPPPMPSERSTGLVFAAVAVVVAVIFRDAAAVAATALAAAAGFAGLAVLAPGRLAALNRAWFGLALALNRVVSPVVMLVLFAAVIVPAGLVMQLRRDPLQKRPDRSRGSYWLDRPAPAAPHSMRDQF